MWICHVFLIREYCTFRIFIIVGWVCPNKLVLCILIRFNIFGGGTIEYGGEVNDT